MTQGFQYEIEKPWNFEGSPEFHKATFNGEGIGLQALVNMAELMREKLESLGYHIELNQVIEEG